MKNDILVNKDANIYMRKITEQERNYIRLAIVNHHNGSKLRDEFILKFGFSIKQIIAFGDTNKISYDLLKQIIPETGKLPGVPRPIHGSYQCYAVKNPSIVLHEDRQASWNCLLQMTSNPEFVVIYINENHEN